MAYRLKKREGIATGVRRIVHAELARAIDELEANRSDDAGTAVHEARKHLKKTRAALRLVRDDLGAGLRRDENAALRDAQAAWRRSRRRGAPRDARTCAGRLERARVRSCRGAA